MTSQGRWTILNIVTTIAATAVLAAPTDAKAQEQTVEGAQEFLRTIAEQGALDGLSSTPGWRMSFRNLTFDGPCKMSGSVTYRTDHYREVVANAAVFDFAQVRRAEVSGDDVILTLSSGHFRHLTNDPSLAARVAFAMEFLRQSCDPAAATGF